MGELIKISCPKCGQEWNSKRGHGKNHARLEVVCELFEESVQAQIMQLAGENPFPVFGFGYKPVVCKECGKVDSVPVLEFPREQAVFVGKCVQCGQEITVGALDGSLECPNCEEQELEIERIGFWD